MKDFIYNLEKLGPFENHPTLAVAVSGGADSLALTLLAFEYAKKKLGKIIALTVDHKLRAESTKESLQLHGILTKLDIEHYILNWERNSEIKSNIQSQARKARYQLLTDFCNKNHILHLLVAHHKNDQIETFMMRLERGSGVSGLASMNDVHYINKVRVIRPLLDTHPDKLKNYLKEQNISWFEDPSNLNLKFTRIKFRLLLKNYDDLSLDRIFNTSISMKRANYSIKKNIYAQMIKLLKIYPAGYATLDVKLLLELAEEESLRILSNVLTTIGGNEHPPRYESIQRLYDKINSDHFFSCTLGSCKLSITSNLLLVCKELKKSSKQESLIYDHSFKWDNRFLITFKENNLIMNSGALKITYFNHKIDELKKVTNIPKSALTTLPVFIMLDKVVSAPYIGYNTIKDIEKYIKCNFQPQRALTGVL
jgi:tRNA(Ile)-lysidine synthase